MEEIGRLTALLLVCLAGCLVAFELVHLKRRPYGATQALLTALLIGLVTTVLFSTRLLPSRYKLSLLADVWPILLNLVAIFVGVLSLRKSHPGVMVLNAFLILLCTALTGLMLYGVTRWLMNPYVRGHLFGL